MKIEHAWVLFDTKASKWLDDQEWTSNFDLAKIFRSREEACWTARLISEPGTLQLQQIEAIWVVKNRENIR